MEDKRIQLITNTSRSGAAFERTTRQSDFNSLIASDVKAIKWILSLINALELSKRPTDLKSFWNTEFGESVQKQTNGQERLKLAAWWRFALLFKKELGDSRGRGVVGAAIAMVEQERERASYTLIKNPITAKRAGIEQGLFERVEAFIKENWRELTNRR